MMVVRGDAGKGKVNPKAVSDNVTHDAWVVLLL